ncbi:MAG: HEAT repeat domain-containing protein [Desulfobacterales bacterium]
MRGAVTLLSLICIALVIIPPLEAKAKQHEAQRLMKKLAKSRNDSVRADAAWQLGQMGATDAVPALVAALEDKYRSVRANAAASLWNLGEASRPAMPALRKALDDPYAGVAGNAAGALVRLGVAKIELVPVYKRLLAEERCRFRFQGIKGLIGLVPSTELFHDALECSCNADSKFKDQSAAGDILRKLMNKNDRNMIPLILEALKTQGDNCVTDLVISIVQYDPPVAEALPMLEKLLKSSDVHVRRVTAQSLGMMKGPALATVPALIKLAESDPDPGVREEAATAIGDMGEAAKGAVPALIRIAQDDRWPKVRAGAMQALGDIGEEAREAIPVLRTALNDPDPATRLSARNALFSVDRENRAKFAKSPDYKMTPTVAGSSLFEDASALALALSSKLPEAFQLFIYNNYAIAVAPEASSANGYGSFTYRNGAITGPDNGDPICKKLFRFADFDFSIIPRLVKSARDHAKKPNGRITYVALDRGVFCNKVGWRVCIQNIIVQYSLDGKLEQVIQ